VLTLILILASFAMPSYHVAIATPARQVLRDDLFTLRKLIDEFTIDKQRPPTSLDELVDAGLPAGRDSHRSVYPVQPDLEDRY